jgi:nucleotide-binding universal stress UspA family protein
VGVDGSSNSEYALDWAMKEAAVRGVPLTVVVVNEVIKSHWTGSPVIFPVDSMDLEKVRHAAEDLTARAASRLGDGRPASVTVRAMNGFPVQELVDASKDADLIVVGSRSGGDFARLMLGSVSNQVAHHAQCPVVVVPHKA